MNLLIDIGNSRIKWILHDNLKNKYGLSGAMINNKQGMDESFNNHWRHLTCPDRILVSNVSGSLIAGEVNEWAMKEWQVDTEYVMTETIGHGVKNAYENPHQLGVDRWMAMIAAWYRYQEYHESICVIDCGTATTIDGISESGQHLGGLIIPGYALMQKALINNTSDIRSDQSTVPSIELTNTTEQGVNNGCFLAIIAIIDRVVLSMKNESGGKLKCIITGGNAEMVLHHLTAVFDCEPDLVLHGLAISSEQTK